jgi:hypothetical protein
MDDEEVEEFNNINIFKANSSEQKLIKSLHDEINVLKKQLEQRVEPVIKKQLNVDNIFDLHNSPKKIYPTISEVVSLQYSDISSTNSNEFIEESNSESKIPKQFKIVKKPKTFKMKKTKEQIDEELRNIDIADQTMIDEFRDELLDGIINFD